MNGIHEMALAALTARDRIGAVHSFFDRPRTGAWWAAAAIILLVVAAAIFLAAILVHRFRDAKRRRQFQKRAGEAGMNAEEQKLLGHLANLAGLRQTDAVLDAPDAFDRGAEVLLQSERVSAMDADLQARTRALVNTLREKLGFARQESLDPTHGAVWLGKIPMGTSVEVVRPSSPEPFQAVLAGEEAVAEQIVLEPAVAMRCEGNESWTLRYAEGGLLWEFDARVVRQEDTGRVVMLPGGKVRCINRRKFIRTPVRISAFVAPFPFLRDQDADGPPRFLPATVVEIAGPGLRIQAPLEVGMGERMLVGLKMPDRKVMQALGITRRPTIPNDQGIPEIVVELIGLLASEVSELVRVTNAAVHASRGRRGPELAAAAAGASLHERAAAVEEG